MDYVLINKKSTFIDNDSKIGKNVIIYENNRIESGSVIEDNVTIFPNSYIVNSIIGKGAKIYSSVIQNSQIGERCLIEPYVFVKNSQLGCNCKIGSFSIIKRMKIENNVSFNHLKGEKSRHEEKNID